MVKFVLSKDVLKANFGNSGKCTDPSVIFAAGLDGRKATEFSFEPHNLAEFNHGVSFAFELFLIDKY